MNGRCQRVLVVDDDENTVEFVRAALESDTIEVVGASDGPAGLSQARREPPDVIILDIYMPRQVGFYTLRDLKADPKTKHIPVVVLTAVGRRLGIAYAMDDIYRSLGTEPEAHLEKPIDPAILRQEVRKLLHAGPAERGPMASEGADNEAPS